eukprot:scaffold4764_cov84-Cylindrotheca_fusiformis.AAC.5
MHIMLQQEPTSQATTIRFGSNNGQATKEIHRHKSYLPMPGVREVVYGNEDHSTLLRKNGVEMSRTGLTSDL